MEKILESETLDARWFPRLKEVFFEDYEKLSGTKDERQYQKESFLKGENTNPNLDYPELEIFNFEEREEKLTSLKEDILEMEQNPAVKKLYHTKINEQLASLRMLKATRNGDDRKFSRYADFIYGKPAEEDVSYIVRHVQEIIHTNIDSEDNEKREAALRLAALFDSVPLLPVEGVDKSILPKGERILGKLESAEVAASMLEEALSKVGADNWTVVIDSEKGIYNFRTSQEEEVVWVPSDEVIKSRGISNKKFAGLIEHEVNTHVARRVNGERTKLQLLGLGLDRYLPGEEGISRYNEQQVTGAKEFAGVPRYLPVALAKGLGGEMRDFRQTFEIMKDYRLLSSIKKDASDEYISDLAYNDCMKIFRGTTCATPGAVYPKEMVYFANRKIWTLVSKNSDVVQLFSIGKFDPNNPQHIELLIQLGILDEDLDCLEWEESPEPVTGKID